MPAMYMYLVEFLSSVYQQLCVSSEQLPSWSDRRDVARQPKAAQSLISRSLDETYLPCQLLLRYCRPAGSRIREYATTVPIPKPAIPEDNAATVTWICLISQLYSYTATSRPVVRIAKTFNTQLVLAPPTHVELL